MGVNHETGEFESPHLHQRGLVTDQAFCFPPGRLPKRRYTLVSPIARAGQVLGAVVLTGGAIFVPFRARRHRFATVSHGHSRPLDLGVLYYRCVATRMVRIGSLSPADNGDVIIGSLSFQQDRS